MSQTIIAFWNWTNYLQTEGSARAAAMKHLSCSTTRWQLLSTYTLQRLEYWLWPMRKPVSKKEVQAAVYVRTVRTLRTALKWSLSYKLLCYIHTSENNSWRPGCDQNPCDCVQWPCSLVPSKTRTRCMTTQTQLLSFKRLRVMIWQ